MSKINEWVNDTKWHKEYAAAIAEGTKAVDAAKAQRDKAYESAKLLNAELSNETHNTAQSAYNAAVSAAQNKMRSRMEKLAGDLVEALEAAYEVAPTEAQTNYIAMMKLRDSLTTADVKAAFKAVSGSALAILTLRDVLRGKQCSDTKLPACAPFEVFDVAEARRLAERFTGNAAANLSTYAHSVCTYMSADGGNGWAYAPKWTALCYFMEQLGA